ncbi:class I SAM-dependent methyltransferase [Mesorhizobium sp.]|uniref:class I SAM-dependent methyltransferase n=1 Tax=Mesorhizobium sp. TaxID=1871066 RepID=UPI000FE95876|nr:class I SAM-dependent methyltransferase [Mesorhizobium sp.]RWP65916.1 MAG: class I SAM-dependent methyltransferase [Mesorhizobium sp.]TIM77330.1 MAG: class I SAM-dependent methyltransferase [Mesorhizobium sp.]
MLRTIISGLYDMVDKRYDSRAAAELSRLQIGYLPWTGSAISPTALMAILNDIQINERRSVVEFGSGLSTVYMAKIMQRLGGRLISFEDNDDWARQVSAMLEAAGLAQYATVVVAPLTSCEFSVGDLPWYDTEVVRNAMIGHQIDCILVDGPPAYRRESHMARYPAVPVMAPHLADRFSIYLDDARRPGEKTIVSKWTELLNIKFVLQPGGVCRGIKGRAFHSSI